MKGQLVLAIIAAALLSAGCAGQAILTGIPETGTPAATAAGIPETVTPTATAAGTQGAPTAPFETPASSSTFGTSVFATPVSSPAFTTTAETHTASPTTSPTFTSSTAPGPTELKYRLIAQFGQPFFCDPDYYPVARQLSEAEFQRRFAQIQSNTEVYQAILLHLGLAGQAVLTPQQERLVYADYKTLNAISLQPAEGGYQFGLRVPANQRTGTAIEGLIDPSGAISVTSTKPSSNMCPICLAVDTLIATPGGEIRVQDLQKGMPVWTSDASGVKRPGVILETVRRDLPGTVALLDLVLQDGRELVVSAGHPLTDSRIVGDLAAGDIVDGSPVKSVEGISYQGYATYDILPSGGTGFYWANGILVKSTLAP